MEQLVFEPVTAPTPWHAFRVELHAYPLDEKRRELLHTFSTLLNQSAKHLLKLQPTLWLDTQELHRDGGPRLFSSNARKWSPAMGFCFDPTGPAPRTLQMSDFMDREWGTPIKVHDRSAIHVSNYDATADAYRLICGRGLALLLYFSEGAQLSVAVDRFKNNTRAVLEPLVASNSFKHHNFYLPLLSSSSLSKAAPDDLLAWMGDTEIYLRENFEDKELLLLAKPDLNSLFDQIGMQRLSSHDGPAPWTFSRESLQKEAS